MNALFLLAQTGSAQSSEGINWHLLIEHAIAACVFSVLGVIVLALAIVVMNKVVPFSMRKEIEEDQNTALGIIVGSIILGISLIIAASISG